MGVRTNAIRSVIFLVLLILSTSANAQLPQYKLHDLGTLGSSASAVAINNAGQIICRSNNHSYLWQNGVSTDLEVSTGYNIWATDINDYGVIAGSFGRHAVVWDNSNLNDLGTLGGANSIAAAVNNRGQIVGSSDVSYSNSTHAFLWSDGVMYDISPGYEATGSAYCINEGSMVGGKYKWHPMSGGEKPALLFREGAVTLGFNPGAVKGLNNIGTAVGYVLLLSQYTQPHAWIWGAETLDLGLLIGGGNSCANAINDIGQTVGYSDDNAFIWDNGEWAFLESLGGSTNAIDINQNGWIVGSSTDSSGVAHAVLWEPVPEPSSILVLLFGFGVSLRRLRGRSRPCPLEHS